MSSSGDASATPMAMPTSSQQSQTPGPHVSISPQSLAEKPHPGEPSSPPAPKSPKPPTASLGAAGSTIMDGEGSGSILKGSSAAQNDSAASSSAQIPSPPPEVEATLSKLTAHANVTGVLVLSRPEALVIRSGGSYFDPSGTGASDRAIRLKSVVNLVRNAVLGLERDVPKAEAGDELCFLRIRTKKYEMMVSPSEKYLLVVLQDPTMGA